MTSHPVSSPVTVTVDEIHGWLKRAARGLVENHVLTEERVSRRAQHLAEDINTLEIQSFNILGIHEFKRQIGGQEVTLPLVEYTFGETRQNINNAGPNQRPQEMARIRCMEGTSLNREDLCYFARVSEIGRETIPHLWLADKGLRDDLRTPQKHLSTLNEVWWLDLPPCQQTPFSSCKESWDRAKCRFSAHFFCTFWEAFIRDALGVQ